MNNRAYSFLEIKSVDEDKRIVRGVATTPSVDRMGDIIDPLGMKFENPLAFLWQHKHDEPIGSCKFEKPTKSGINFEATIAQVDEPGTLKDRLDEAWQSIKAGLVRAVSVGFRPLEFSFMDNGGIRYSETECYELSAVTIPANSEALITAVKSLYGKTDLDVIKAIDAEWRHEAGIPDPEIPEEPTDEGATAKTVRVVKLGSTAGVSAPPYQIKQIKRIPR
jgi:HK97 family phage prohead protease